MPFVPKKLDDRTFEDLVQEARRRIAAYVPEWQVDQRGQTAKAWTEYNPSDPGITLVDVFAFLTETTLFRLNRAPDERMYLEFLNLLGQAPRPALAASLPLVFEMRETGGSLEFEPHQLRFSAPGEEEDIFFEPDEKVSLIRANLGALLVDDRATFPKISRLAENEKPDQSFAPFGASRIKDRALYFGFDTELDPATNRPRPLLGSQAKGTLQIFVRAEDPQDALQPASTAFGAARTAGPNDVVWEQQTGDKTWERVEASDETDGLRRTGFVRLTVTDSIIAKDTTGDDPQGTLRFWIRARVEVEGGEEKRSLRYVAPNSAVLRQWRTYTKERLGGSNGTPLQTFAVRHPPILLDPDLPPTLLVDEPPETEWTLVEDLASRIVPGQVFPEDFPARVFRITEDESAIQFGDGIDGRIPPSAPNNLFLTYRSGGGSIGNGMQQLSLDVQVPDIRGFDQLEPASGGRDQEDVEAARRSAPQRVKALAAVTPENFEALAGEAGAARAIALNRVDPRFPDAPATGALTLIVIPEAPPDQAAPRPDQDFLRQVSTVLEEYRVLTTELFVVAPRYEPVQVEVEIVPTSRADADDAREEVQERLFQYLHPVRGGLDERGWPHRQEIRYGELMSVLLDLPHVRAVLELTVIVRKERYSCKDAPMPKGSDLWESTVHSIRLGGKS